MGVTAVGIALLGCNSSLSSPSKGLFAFEDE
jgi:hypothetical protein